MYGMSTCKQNELKRRISCLDNCYSNLLERLLPTEGRELRSVVSHTKVSNMVLICHTSFMQAPIYDSGDNLRCRYVRISIVS